MNKGRKGREMEKTDKQTKRFKLRYWKREIKRAREGQSEGDEGKKGEWALETEDRQQERHAVEERLIYRETGRVRELESDSDFLFCS